MLFVKHLYYNFTMEIFYEIEWWLILTEKKNNKIQKKIVLSNLEWFLNNVDNLDNKIFLLDEEKFMNWWFDIYIEKKTPFNIWEIKEIIDEKYEYILINYWKPWERIFYSIDDIFVDLENKEYLIWQKWKIHFKLNLFFLKKDYTYMFNKIIWSWKLDNTRFKIYPQSFFTINYLKKIKSSKSINLLYFNKNTIKLITIKNWSYNKIEKLNMWMSRLKEMFEEDDIIRLYYDSFVNEELNTISMKLIERNMNFYSSTICAWLLEHIWNIKDLIIIWDILKNKHFVESFNNQFTETIKWYVIPFNYSDWLEKYWKRWNYSDLDTLTFLNSRISK